jgi:hypothetical protein
MSGADPKISNNPQAMWDLVNFVRALPYPPMLPGDVKAAIYGKAK